MKIVLALLFVAFTALGVAAAVVEASGSRPVGPFAFDPQGLELGFDPPPIAVLLRTAGGDPHAGGTAPRYYNVRQSQFGDWPDQAHVLVFASLDGGGTPLAAETSSIGRETGKGAFTFDSRPGESYWVGAIGGGFRGRFRRITMPASGAPKEIVLTAEPNLELGEVTVEVVTGREPKISFHTARNGCRVELVSIESGVTLLTSVALPEDTALTFQAPPGRYRVVAEGQPFVDSWHGELFEERSLGLGEVEVDLRAGATTLVEVEVGAVARIELLIHGERSPLDRAAALERFPSLEDERLASLLLDHASVSLHRRGRRPEPLVWKLTWSNEARLKPDWPFGEPIVSQVVPEGRYELRVKTLGGRTVSQPVELRADETLSLEVRLPE